MNKYVGDFLTSTPTDMEGVANTPAASHLLQINNQSPVFLTADVISVVPHLDG
jgi:hypothetical protein